MDRYKLHPDQLSPKRLYRVQYGGCMTSYDDHTGLQAQGDEWHEMPINFGDAVERHLNWDEEISILISLFSDENHAENWLLDRHSRFGSENCKLLEIDPTKLEHVYRAQELVDKLYLRIRREANASVRKEYLVAYEIPRCAIISCSTVEEIQAGKQFVSLE